MSLIDFINKNALYVTLDDNNKIYKVNKDYSKEVVDKLPEIDRDNWFMLIHKSQFESTKGYFLNADNPHRIKIKTAKIYNKIGFLSDSEFDEYRSLLEGNESKLTSPVKDNQNIRIVSCDEDELKG